MKNKETDGYGGEEKKKMVTVKKEKEKEERKEKKCSLMRKRKEEGKRKRKKRNKWPKFILKTRKDNKNYEITKLPLNTNLGYYTFNKDIKVVD